MQLSNEEIANIRKMTGLTQEVFAETYGIPCAALAAWEQGHRCPNKTSMVYLRLIQSDPDGMARRVEALKTRKSRTPRRQLQAEAFA